MNKGEFLEKEIKKKGYRSIMSFSKESGVAYTTLRSMIERNLLNASIDNVQKVCKALGISMDALASAGEEHPSNLYKVGEESLRIPVMGDIACGDPIYVEENFSDYRVEPKENLPSGNLFYLMAKGGSMEPSIPDGSMVLIREQPDVESGEIAAVLLNGDTEATLKRVKKQGDNIVLTPDNNKYDLIFVDESNPATIIGKALRFTRDL